MSMNLGSVNAAVRALVLGASLGTLAIGCSADESAADLGGQGGGGAGVGQGGAQDFGQFREILDAGEIPGPQTLDDVGFFNEHKVDFPAPDCGQDVCLHGQLGVMGNMITGSNCTLVLMGMNTPIDPSTYERPPLNLAIVVDTSGSMSGESIEYVREGLYRMLDDLEEGDRISLVTFADEAQVQVESVAGGAPELTQAIGQLHADGGTNLYDGLRTGYETVSAHAEDGRQNRVILLSDGEATVGILNDERLVSMSTAYNELGLSLSTIGMGEGFDPELMRSLAESGAGSFYFLEDPKAVQEVFEEEVSTFLVPLAEDLRIDVDIDPGYALRAMYGTKRFELEGQSGAIDIPTVQIAHRVSDEDQAGGRRGGGGAIIVELTPRPGEVLEAGTVGRLAMSYRRPGSEEIVTQEVQITSSLAPGETPTEGAFDAPSVEKAFVMLNIYAGFEMAAVRASFGDDRGALGVLQPLRDSVSTWLETNDDADIEDDLRYIDRFIANLRARGASEPPPQQNPPEPWPND